MGNFSAEDIRLAQETQAKYGVPASVTLAQYALESGYGSSSLAKRANNYFGISGKNVNTGKFVMSGGRTWAAYNSKAESFYDHGRLLSTNLYARKTKGITNGYDYIDAIAETYAPSSDGNNNYAGTIKQIISQNNLTQYDTGGAVSGGTSGSSGGSGGFTGTRTTAADMMAAENASTLGKIVKFLALAIVGVFAAVLFFQAFDMKPVKAVKSVTKKAVKSHA